jgi:protein-S-isoprenylcysteine O-methyltransferase Ste14
MVAVVVPALLVWAYGADFGWDLPAPASILLVIAGLGLLSVGLSLWLQTIRLFVEVGRGTLAPWDPPRRFVVRGPYRRVRNPMISALGIVLLGETAVLGSWPVATLFAWFAIVNAIYIPLLEEPRLLRRFGAQYEEYRRAVPRWIPRRTPWSPGHDQGAPENSH